MAAAWRLQVCQGQGSEVSGSETCGVLFGLHACPRGLRQGERGRQGGVQGAGVIRGKRKREEEEQETRQGEGQETRQGEGQETREGEGQETREGEEQDTKEGEGQETRQGEGKRRRADEEVEGWGEKRARHWEGQEKGEARETVAKQLLQHPGCLQGPRLGETAVPARGDAGEWGQPGGGQSRLLQLPSLSSLSFPLFRHSSLASSLKRLYMEARQQVDQPQPESVQLQSKTAQLHLETAQLHPETAQLHPEITQLHPETAQLQLQTAQLQTETAKVQQGIIQLQPEKAQFQCEAVQLQPKTAKLQPETVQLQPETAHLPSETAKLEVAQLLPEKAQFQEEAVQLHPETVKQEPEAAQLRQEIAQLEPETTQLQPETEGEVDRGPDDAYTRIEVEACKETRIVAHSEMEVEVCREVETEIHAETEVGVHGEAKEEAHSKADKKTSNSRKTEAASPRVAGKKQREEVVLGEKMLKDAQRKAKTSRKMYGNVRDMVQRKPADCEVRNGDSSLPATGSLLQSLLFSSTGKSSLPLMVIPQATLLTSDLGQPSDLLEPCNVVAQEQLGPGGGGRAGMYCGQDSTLLPALELQLPDENQPSHNEKEQRRRARIKGACQRLRELVPGMTNRTDAATVFEFAACYIEHLRLHAGPQFDKEFLRKYSSH